MVARARKATGVGRMRCTQVDPKIHGFPMNVRIDNEVSTTAAYLPERVEVVIEDVADGLAVPLKHHAVEHRVHDHMRLSKYAVMRPCAEELEAIEIVVVAKIEPSVRHM